MVLKSFSVTIHAPKPKSIKEVLWCPSHNGWIKVNIDESFSGSPLQATCGRIFRNHRSDYLGSFACNLDLINAFSTEMMAATLAMKYVATQKWIN